MYDLKWIFPRTYKILFMLRFNHQLKCGSRCEHIQSFYECHMTSTTHTHTQIDSIFIIYCIVLVYHSLWWVHFMNVMCNHKNLSTIHPVRSTAPRFFFGMLPGTVSFCLSSFLVIFSSIRHENP